MEQNPIFIPLECIDNFPPPIISPEQTGLTELTGKNDGLIRGFRCPDIEAAYKWRDNGSGKGYTQQLRCFFDGGEEEFNYLMNYINRGDNRFIVLLPRKHRRYIVVGDFAGNSMSCEGFCEQTFLLENPYSLVPFPYYQGKIVVKDVTVAELMDALYGKRD